MPDRRTLGLVFAAAMVGCEREAEPERAPDFEIETERMVIRGYGRSESELCGGTARWMDDYIDALAPFYDLPAGKIGNFRWYSDMLWDELNICPGGGACVLPTNDVFSAFARSIPHEHELAHLMKRPSCIYVLEEGLASFMRGSYPVEVGTPTAAHLAHLFDKSFDLMGEREENDYATARHFVSFLVANHGLESVVELCRATPIGTTREEFDEISTTQLGRDLGQLIDDYASHPQCTNAQDRARILECGRAPSVAIGPGDQMDVEIAASCANEMAIGPLGDAFHVSFQVRILEAGDYSWGIQAPLAEEADFTGVVMRFEQCAACADDPFISEWAWQPDWIFFPESIPAGDYVFELSVPLEFDDVIVVGFDGPPPPP